MRIFVVDLILPFNSFSWDWLGIRGHFRYKPTVLNDESSGDFCDPFGFCQDTLQQIEIAAGGVIRF